MADANVTELAEITSPALTDLLYVGADPAGTPADKKSTIANVLKLIYPVGSVYINASDSTNPGTLLGFGTWSAFGAGRVMVGLDSGDPDFDAAEETGGAKTVTLTAAQSGLPQHTHTQDAHNHTQNAHTHNFLPRSGTTGSVSSIVTGTLDTSSTISGNNQPHIQNATATNQEATAVNQDAGPTDAASAHPNLQPYIVVHAWKRTA